MTHARRSPPRDVVATRVVWRFLQTPKGLLLLVLLVLAAVEGRVEGVRPAGTMVLSAVLAAVALDVPLTRWRRGRVLFPSGAAITGLLVAGVLSLREPWYVGAVAAAVAILSKHLLRVRSVNVFNPAAVGLVAVFYGFESGQNWWAALPLIVPAAAWPLLLGPGIFVAARVNRLPLATAFLAVYFAVFSAATFVVSPSEVAEVFVPPDLLAVLFFGAFMITDPPTSPTPVLPQIAFGAVVACASAAIFLGVGAAHYLLSGLLVGNLFEAIRRLVSRRSRYRPRES